MSYGNEIDITSYTNETFSYAFDISDWATQYPLASCKFRMQMAALQGQPPILEWSTDNARLIYTEAPASGAYTFTAQPAAGQAITFGTSAVTFVASGASGSQVNIGGTLATSLSALLSFLQGSSDSQLSLASWSLSGLTLRTALKATGALGNLIPISTNVAGCTTSAPTLTNGMNVLSVISPMVTTQDLNGSYGYDLRLEYQNVDDAILASGTITWLPGYTTRSDDGLITPVDLPVTASVTTGPSLLNALIFG